MGKFYTEIPPEIIPWIAKQEAFWVGTAPLDGNGHVNVSPKGTKGTFHVVDTKTCWYEDLTGSGMYNFRGICDKHAQTRIYEPLK